MFRLTLGHPQTCVSMTYSRTSDQTDPCTRGIFSSTYTYNSPDSGSPTGQRDRRIYIRTDFTATSTSRRQILPSDNETPVRQVSPLLGTTPRENLQLRNRNSPDDISDNMFSSERMFNNSVCFTCFSSVLCIYF